MASAFPSTAEHVVGAVEAAAVRGQSVDPQFVSEFADIELAKAENALELARELGLLTEEEGSYRIANPACRFFVAGRQSVAIPALRLVLESYGPFLTFRARLEDTPDSTTAARQTKAAFGLTAHRDSIRDTLVSLGTYSHALKSIGGGRYGPAPTPAANALADLANGVEEASASEIRVRNQLGSRAVAYSSQADVIVPLADALSRAGEGDGPGAVQQAGNAVEAYLVGAGARVGVELAGANGINAKVERFRQQAHLPKKIENVSKYLGHVRNAADHGPDGEIGEAWGIRPNTGIEYVFLSCSFLSTLALWEAKEPMSL